MIEQSVGLMGGELSWLALEGLIRQQTNFKWELLVSDKSPDIYKKYLSNLRKANCVQVKVYPDLKPDKFKTVVDPNSRVLVIVNHDTFSHFSRLQESKDVKEVIYTDYQLSYSPAKKTFIQMLFSQLRNLHCPVLLLWDIMLATPAATEPFTIQ